jgi:hypothetical protein
MLRPEQRAVILLRIEAGNFPLTAAKAERVSREQWLEELKDPKLRADVERSEALSECGLVEGVRQGGKAGDSFVLERRFHARWGLHIKEKLQEERSRVLAAVKSELDEVTFLRVANALKEAERKAS